MWGALGRERGESRRADGGDTTMCLSLLSLCVTVCSLSFIFSTIIKIIKRETRTCTDRSIGQRACKLLVHVAGFYYRYCIGIADVCPLRVDVPQSRGDAAVMQAPHSIMRHKHGHGGGASACQPPGERQLRVVRAKGTAGVSCRSASSCRGRWAIWPSASAASISSKAACTRHCSSARHE